MSLLENMRVKRSLTDVFSAAAGFSRPSEVGNEVDPLALGVLEEASGFRAGDFLAPSWELMEDGFELGVDCGFGGSAGAVVDIVRCRCPLGEKGATAGGK
jgi:hypothetical protein